MKHEDEEALPPAVRERFIAAPGRRRNNRRLGELLG